MILVDHNERGQAVDGIENANILELIDHHPLDTVETVGPVFFRNQPLGCTATIIFQMYREQGLEIDKTIAMYEDVLADIKRGVMYSRSVDGQDQLIMSYDPADISTSTDTEVTRP